MTASKSSVVLNSLSVVFLLVLISICFFTHTNPFVAVFLFMKAGLLFFVLWCVLVIASIVSLFRNKKDGYIKSSLPLTINLISLVLVLISVNLDSAQYLTDKDIVIYNKVLSADGSHEIIEYAYDIGALGYTTIFTAIVPLKDESKNLSKFRLPNEYKHAKWLSNESIEVEVDVRGYQVKKKDFRQDVSHIGDIKVVARTKEFDTSLPLFVEHRSLSPDGRKELVAYRYRDHMESGHLHISIIKKGEPIPVLGNLYIGNQHNDYVYFGEWRTSDSIVLYTESKYTASQYLLDNDVLTVEFVEKKYGISGVQPGWYHKPPFGSDNYLENELKQYGRSGTAVVIDKFYYADGRRTGTMDVLYAYRYNGKAYSAVFREKEGADRTYTRVGDKLPIIFSSNRPDIHKIVR